MSAAEVVWRGKSQLVHPLTQGSVPLMRVIPMIVLVLSACPRTALAQQSFYIIRHFFSDDASAWNDKVLEVTQSADDVRVRFMQISLAHHECGALLVQAVERVLPHTRVSKVAGTNMCARTEREVAGALGASNENEVLTEASSQHMHVQCDSGVREFDFPYDSRLDQKKLARSYPQVAALQNAMYHVRDAAFGRSFWFQPDAQQVAREQLGLSMVPELTSGKYDTALGAGLIERLKQYTIPPTDRGPRRPRLLEAAALHVTNYEAPAYPAIARSARIQGDVRLRLIVDSITGAVTGVDVLSGPSIIDRSALEAAKSWRFDPLFLAGPVEVTVRFSLDC